MPPHELMALQVCSVNILENLLKWKPEQALLPAQVACVCIRPPRSRHICENSAKLMVSLSSLEMISGPVGVVLEVSPVPRPVGSGSGHCSSVPGRSLGVGPEHPARPNSPATAATRRESGEGHKRVDKGPPLV